MPRIDFHLSAKTLLTYDRVIIASIRDIGPYAKKGAPSIKELLPKDSEELPKGTS